MRIYKLHALLAAGSTDSAAQLDIVEDGKIQTIAWSGAPLGMDALNDEFRAEVSFSSTNNLNSNDVRQAISEVGAGQNFLTSGGGAVMINHTIGGLNINVIAGERIHLHAFTSTGVIGRLSCFLYIADGSGGRTRTRRMR